MRLYAVTGEQCELIMSRQIDMERAGDRISAVHFFIKAKSIIVTTEKGNNIIFSTDLNNQTKFFNELHSNPTMEPPFVTFLNMFTHKNERYFAAGLSNGQVIVKYHH